MLKKLLIGSIALSIGFAAQAEVPNVVTTIKPLHSLVAQIMDGVGEPKLLIKEGSPHAYALKPSDVKAMNDAQLLVWVSDDLETFMAGSAAKIKGAKTLIWDKSAGVKLLKTRSGGLWEEAHHHHGDEDSGFSHMDGGHDHHHGEYNIHLWLGTENAAPLLKAVAADLSILDKDNADKYEQNLQTALKNLQTLHQEVAQSLEGVARKPYMTFHDAYPYFEEEFALNPVGVVRADLEHEPGAKRIGELRAVLQENKVACIFNEPQFSSKLTDKLIEGTQVKVGVLDPVGADLATGPAMFGELQKNLAKGLKDCFAE